MKQVKIIGLAALAVAAVMAFVGAGTASADVLCTENVQPCPKGKTVTEIVASLNGASANLTDTSNNSFATCTVGEVKGTVEKQGLGVNPQGPISALTWGASGAGCNTTVNTVTKGRLELRTEEGESFVWASGSEVTLIAFGVSCTYGAGTGTKIGTVDQGKDAKLTLNAVVKKTAGGFLCPETAKWGGSYTITNHTEVWVKESALD